MRLKERILAGEVRAAARLIKEIDDGEPHAIEELKELYPHTGRAYILGVTGSPGVGKSTLVDRLIETFRKEGKRVAVVAVDPTSPFSGGAILGDRIRMQSHATDEGVFIRSLATRGHLGGLSPSTRSIIHVFDAMGWDIIIVETVGVGQDEVEIFRAAETSIVITAPGLGDEIQAMKAGILEIADIFVVNKADREGSDRAVAELEAMLEMKRYEEDMWRPPVVPAEAIKGKGTKELRQAIDRHRAYLGEKGRLARRARERVRMEIGQALEERISEKILEGLEESGKMNDLIDRIARRETDPYTVVDELLAQHLRDASSARSGPRRRKPA